MTGPMLPANLPNLQSLLRKYSHTLDKMEFVSRTPGSIAGAGRRPGTTGGYSVDFADYQKYNYGDDIRHIDWNIYARLKKLFLRQFRAESELSIHLLLDVSNSMQFGRCPKMEFAREIAAALGYVGLSKQDRVGLTTFSDRLLQYLPPQRGNRQLAHIIKMLDNIVPGGPSEFEQAFRPYVARASSRGLAIILSDCFAPKGYQNAFHCLAYGGFEVVLIRIVSEEELSPELEDGIELRDLENKDLRGPIVSKAVLSQYKKNVKEHSEELSNFCLGVGIPMVEAVSSVSFEELTLKLMRAGIWRSRK
jgi:uncharacterized protein (DUF58 family)